jgi:RNA polymerase sigma-70 factor (ECF subfamily)
MTVYSHYSDEDLMKEIRAGNMFAFDELYRKYNKRLYKFSYAILKSHEEAQNNTQDVFLNLWLNRNKVEKESSVKYYIFTISYNSAISVIRKKANQSKFFEYVKTLQNLVQEPVDLQFEYDELNEKLNKIINELPKRQREVYKLHKIEGLKYSEIAEKLNISTNTIENHMSRALKAIQKNLRPATLIIILFYYLNV